ncbi:hypothetical protein [Thermoanaerobacter sp. A7A]|uniref:hypothetical protein n=1 Tax=Thermoanaerobacter sp. A7A TaxID=1350366 RepID=UPI0004199677|nr:hypothetical protein [Thermoanaerobacter sp. A7A]
MILLNNINKLEGNFKHGNCRIQSLWDFLKLHDIFVNPNLLYLHCFDILTALCYILYKNLEYLFLVGFTENFEETFFKKNNIRYQVTNEVNSMNDMVTFIKNGIPLYILCDINTILTQKIPKDGVQIGVCSGLVVVGVDFPGEVICNQMLPKAKGEFLSIDYSVFSRARTLTMYPSSPQNKCIYLELEENQNITISKQLNDVDVLIERLSRIFSNVLNNNIQMISNVGVIGICNIDAFITLKSELKKLGEIDNTPGVAREIIDKVFASKMLILRKSMLSGTISFNRYELADALSALYEITKNPKLKKASNLFRESGNKLRQISRFLYMVSSYIYQKEEFVNEIIDILDEVLNIEIQASEELSNLCCYHI